MRYRVVRPVTCSLLEKGAIALCRPMQNCKTEKLVILLLIEEEEHKIPELWFDGMYQYTVLENDFSFTSQHEGRKINSQAGQ